MSKRTITILSLVFGVCVYLFTFFFSFNLIINKDKNNNKTEKPVKYDKVYYATAEENTGSESASSLYKGGAVYVGDGSTYSLTDATLKGNTNKYGGAVYVADGGTFTMTGGSIEGNSATYGGAIYIATGGTCILNNATIKNNSADNAPAIYVENGGTLEVDGTTNIEGNYFLTYGYKISQDTIRVGHLTDGIDMHYLEYGTYPQTYVGNTMNATLESWYQAENPNIVKTYITTVRGSYGVWNAYNYTDGYAYVRGTSYIYPQSSYEEDNYPTDFKYISGEDLVPTDSVVWFKVEPIKWIILNYDAFVSGTAEEIDVLAYMSIASFVKFYPNSTDDSRNEWWNSNLRSWLNNTFFSIAFNTMEQAKINSKTILNNVTGNYDNAESDGSGITTQDRLWCLSYYELKNVYFISNEQRLCSPTDFAMSNYCFKRTDTEYATVTYPNGGTCCYWTRSSSSGVAFAATTTTRGVVHNNGVNNAHYAVRPAMSLRIN